MGVEVALSEWVKVLNVRFRVQVEYDIRVLCVSRVWTLMGSVSDIPRLTNAASHVKHVQRTQHSKAMCKHADSSSTGITLTLHKHFFNLNESICDSKLVSNADVKHVHTSPQVQAEQASKQWQLCQALDFLACWDSVHNVSQCEGYRCTMSGSAFTVLLL